jgi:hypothetical protein
MGNTHLHRVSEPIVKKQYTPSVTDKPVADELARANLTNKAGAEATPLEKDVQAWLEIGWFRA